MRFRRLAVPAFISVIAVSLSGCLAVPDGVTPVTNFQIDRYLGQWYEIARLDHRFERNLTNVTATYSLNDDGSVRVLNRGFNVNSCAFEEREGRATFIGDRDVASLSVSFFGPFAGGYHVIELAPDYSYAVVSGADKGFFWILSRTPTLDQRLVDRIIGDALAAGFPVDTELTMVNQGPPPC